MNLHRRTLGLVALAITLLGGCATQVSLSDQDRPPVVFVPNGVAPVGLAVL